MLKALLLGLGGLNLGSIGFAGMYHFHHWMRGTHKRAPDHEVAKSE